MAEQNKVVVAYKDQNGTTVFVGPLLAILKRLEIEIEPGESPEDAIKFFNEQNNPYDKVTICDGIEMLE